MYLDGRWDLLVAGPDIVNAAEAVDARLDVALLSRHLLEPILGIGDPRTDRRIELCRR